MKQVDKNLWEDNGIEYQLIASNVNPLNPGGQHTNGPPTVYLRIDSTWFAFRYRISMIYLIQLFNSDLTTLEIMEQIQELYGSDLVLLK